MKERSDPQQKIMELLAADINAGTAAAFKAYGGLVWSACARRLADPEDIRECVNDTFFAFSTGYEKFDPEKGSLGNYLCAIAMRRATDRYRKNQAVGQAEDQYRIHAPAFTEAPFDASDLTQALEQLDPVDAGILREKYYGGMTYQQIAASMGLPYDTVRKRGQRNLKKLRAILIGMILALLAAGCAYLIYRSYQFAEGAGPNFDPDRPIYQLSAVEGGPYALEACTYFVENAIYQDGQLYVKIGVLSNRPWPEGQEEQTEAYMQAGVDFWRLLAMFTAFRIFDADGSPIGEDTFGSPNSTHHDGAGKGTLERGVAWEPARPGDSLTLQVSLSREGTPPESLRQEYLDTGLLSLTDVEKLERAMPVWTITLEKVDFTDEAHDTGTFIDYLDTGFLVRDGVAYPGGTHVLLCPYQMESAYILSDMLLHNYSGSYDDRNITLTARDGAVYTADLIRGASISPLHQRDIHFPEAAAGEYVMTIPYLCVRRAETAQTVTVPVPARAGQTVALDETVSFSDGSSIRLTGIRLERRTVDGFITAQDGTAIPQELLEWDYIVECEMVSGEVPELMGARGVGELSDPGTQTVFALGGDVIGPDSRELVLTVSQANYGHTGYEEGAAYTLSLTFDDPTYILDQQIQIPVTVSEYHNE